MRINNKTRLLVISPHPDDEAIGCGGLIAKCKKEKAEVWIVYGSVGDSRQLVTKKTQSNTRLAEIKNIEKLSGFKTKILYIGKEFCRMDMIPQKDMIEKIEDVIEEFTPNLVAIPCQSSYNQDHRAVYEACITALRPTPLNVRHYVENVLVYYEPYFWANSDLKMPNTYLDLSEKIGKGSLLDFKIKLYQCHKTQVRKEPFPRSVENLRRWAHIYGKEAGIDMAEAYNLIRLKIK
jgi:N-acetylglucosamine malate deacetylase 1